MGLIANVYIPNSGKLDILDAWLAGHLAAAKIHLYVNHVVPALTDTPATFVEASFPGYGPQAVTPWRTPFLNGSNQGEIDSTAITWFYTGLVGSALVYGAYLTDSSGATLLATFVFKNPSVLTPVNNNLVIMLEITDVSQL